MKSPPSRLATRYKKASVDYTSEWAEHAGFGMGPRRWTLLGPLARDHAFSPDQLKSLHPLPGQDGWSETAWFGDDRIDLDKYYEDPINCAVYAFTHFTMATSDSFDSGSARTKISTCGSTANPSTTSLVDGDTCWGA